jgi:polysaccharide biosynthesis/export protein
MKKLNLLVSCCCVVLVIASCKTAKTNLNYFSADKRDSSHTKIWQQFEVKIQPGDRLSIRVSALNVESAKPYSLPEVTEIGGQVRGITVDNEGKILYPQLGFISVAGLTEENLRDTLLNRLRIYLTDPVVTVDIITSKNITVLGEVNKQGPIVLTKGSITILEALGEAGDIATTGRRDSVLVVRENGNKREFGYINMLSNEVFTSPYFILQPRDVVYVQMNNKRIRSENEQEFTRNLSIATSILAVISTLGLLILNLAR